MLSVSPFYNPSDQNLCKTGAGGVQLALWLKNINLWNAYQQVVKPRGSPCKMR